MAVPSSALSRFTVLDLTRVRSGPTAVRQLADWGARVIKIETPAHLAEGEGMGGPRENSDFQNLQRNKRGIALDLKSPQGIAAFRRLVAKADVVVENFRPDVKTRLGIDYESLKCLNKGIVLASISGFGQDGPYAKRPGFDQIAQGMGGLMSITGAPGQGPMRVGIPIADLTAGLFFAPGLPPPPVPRAPSGEGPLAGAPPVEAQGFLLGFSAARRLSEGAGAPQAGEHPPPPFPPGGVRPQEGVINTTATGQAIWERLCRAVEHPEWIEVPAYKTGKLRSDNRDALNAAIEAVTATRTSAEWVDAFNIAGVPCGPIYAVDQMFADPQVKHLDVVAPAHRKDGSPLGLLAQPFHLSRTDSAVALRPPELGEHTDEVLKEFGFSADEIKALHDAKAV